MKVVVTGGSGFVGSNTLKELGKREQQWFNYDTVTGCDILNYDQLCDVIGEGDKVLHEAAVARFADADADPLLAYRINVQGTENVVKACMAKGAERLIYASTGSVYMPLEQEPPITEDFPVRGNSVYACSKCTAEQLVREGSTPWVILRYAHLYGEGKIGHGAVGGFIDRMNKGLQPTIFGGRQSNDFCIVDDIVHANILALDTTSTNEAYNIGTGRELTTIRMFEILREFFKYDMAFEMRPAREVDPIRFVFDISKAKRLLGYSPKYTFEQGIRRWFGNRDSVS